MADIFDSLPTPPPAQGAPAGDIFDQVAAKATPTTADLMRSYKPDYKPPQAPPSSWTDQFKPASMFKALAHPIMASVGGLERNIAANLNPSEIAGNDQGDVAPTPLQNTMNAQAQTYGNIQGAPGPATTGLNMLGGIPGVVAGAAPAAIAGLTSAQGEGQNQGASVINAGFNALLAGGATTDFAKAAVSKLGKFMPDIIAKLGVRGITGMGLGSLDQLATNAASGRPLTEGVAKSGAMFAGQELLGGAVHDVMAPKAEPGPTAEGAAAAKANPAGQVQANMEKMAGMDKMRALRDDAQATNAAAATPEVNRTQNAGQDLRVPDSTLGAPKASPEPTGADKLTPLQAYHENARQEALGRGIDTREAQVNAAQAKIEEPVVAQQRAGQDLFTAPKPPIGIDENARAAEDKAMIRQANLEAGAQRQGEPQPQMDVQEHQDQAALANEMSRQDNAEAMAKHPGTLWDRLKSWSAGKDLATNAKAAWAQATGPIMSRLKKYDATSPLVDSKEGLDHLEHFEKTGTAQDPEHADMAHDMAAFNNIATDAATKAGTDTSYWNPFWAKRLARKPADVSAGDWSNRLAGFEGHLKGRTKITPQDWMQAAKDHGLDIPYKTVSEMQRAGLSEVLKSAKAGEQLNSAVDRGDGMRLQSGEEAPAGWATTEDIIGSNGRNVAVPNGTAWALRNILNRSADSDLSMMNKAMNALKYTFDTMTIQRGILGGFGGEALTHPLQTARNLIPAVRTTLNPDLLNEPRFAKVRDMLTQASEHGFDPAQHETGPKPTAEGGWLNTLGKVPNAIGTFANKKVLASIKQLSALNLVERANQHPEWSQAKTDEYLSAGNRTTDNLVGGAHSPSGLPQTADNLLRAIAPFYKWKTAAERQQIGALGSAMKGNLDPLYRGVVGMIGAHAILNAISQIIDTKTNTGKVVWPTPEDLLFHRTGNKNKDGTDERVSVMSSFLPEAETIGLLAKKEFGQAGKQFINSAWDDLAQAWIGRSEYTGQKLTAGQRAAAAAGAFVFIPQINTKKSVGQNAADIARQLTYERHVPGALTRSDAQNRYHDRRLDR
jgi:hypothetical protein